jgi:hypothetical protein
LSSRFQQVDVLSQHGDSTPPARQLAEFVAEQAGVGAWVGEGVGEFVGEAVSDSHNHGFAASITQAGLHHEVVSVFL